MPDWPFAFWSAMLFVLGLGGLWFVFEKLDRIIELLEGMQ